MPESRPRRSQANEERDEMKSDFRRKLPTRAAHCLFLGGLAAIITGFASIYKPAGYLVAGAVFLWVSFLIAAETPK